MPPRTKTKKKTVARSSAAGARGSTGARGPKGDRGDTGPAGSTGPRGEKGDTGDVVGVAEFETRLSEVEHRLGIDHTVIAKDREESLQRGADAAPLGEVVLVDELGEDER